MGDYADFLARKARRAPKTGIDGVDPFALGPSLFAWQRDVVSWALRRGRAALFCDTGLGKTIMQLEWANAIVKSTGGRLLILAPLAVSKQTAREAERFGIGPVRVVEHPSDVGDGISITNYEKLERFDAGEFVGVVLDEAGILKAFDGQRRNQIVAAFADTPYRLCATATPAPNDFTELGNHAEFLSVMTRPEMLSMFFVHDGGKTQDWRLKGHAKADFWRWLCSWAAVVTDPADLGYPEEGARFRLPELRIHEHIIGKHRLAGWLFDPGEAMDIHERRAARRGSISDRVAWIAEQANATDEQWLVWCDLNDEGDALASAINGAAQVAGADTPEDKEQRLLAFAEGRLRVLVSKPKLAGFGMNFQSCARMAFCGLSDSYEAFYQAVRRCWRFGQTRSVDVHVVVSAAEQAVLNNITKKGQRAQEMRERMSSLTRDAVREEIRGAVKTWDPYHANEAILIPSWVKSEA